MVNKLYIKIKQMGVYMSKEKRIYYYYYWCDNCNDETKHSQEKTDRLSPRDRDPILLITCTKCGNTFEDI